MRAPRADFDRRIKSWKSRKWPPPSSGTKLFHLQPDCKVKENGAQWLTSPVLIAVFTAIFAVIGTAAGAVLQGRATTELAREQFEFGLIEKAVSGNDQAQKATNLKFLVDVGLVRQLDTTKIISAANSPASLPTFSGETAQAEGKGNVNEAKGLLKRLGYYSGPADDNADDAFKKAVALFQAQVGISADGLAGPLTIAAMKQAVLVRGK